MSVQPHRNKLFFWIGLGTALVIATLLSPFASADPDGLDRVSQDHGFEERAAEDAPSQRLPFYTIFDEYALRGVPEGVATPLAGFIGTLVTFGLAWGAGKLLVKPSSDNPSNRQYPD